MCQGNDRFGCDHSWGSFAPWCQIIVEASDWFYPFFKCVVSLYFTYLVICIPAQLKENKWSCGFMRTSVKRIVQEKINTWRQDITLAFIRVLRKYGIMSCMRWSYQIVCGPVKMCGMLDEWVQSENGYYVGFRNICQMKV